MSIILGFGTKARNGKDTAVAAIIAEFGQKYNIRRYSFADALKAEVNDLDQLQFCLKHGIKYDFDTPMDDPICQTKHGKQNSLLQWYGEMRRKEDAFHWVNIVQDRIDIGKPQFALISDMRHLNEYYFVKARKGCTIKVSRYGYTDPSRPANHISETALNNTKFDYEINVNDGEIEQLRRDAVTVFQMILDAQEPVVLDVAA